MSEQEFDFPTQGRLPHHDELAGIAFSQGGLKGSYQVGVLHALVLSGYYPRTISGTSAGALSGGVLALLAEQGTQAERLDLLDRYARTWLANPSRPLLRDLLRQDGPRRLVHDLLDVRLALGEVVRLLRPVLDPAGKAGALTKASSVLRILLALPLWRGRMALAVLLAGAGAAQGLLRGHLALRAAQGALDAYGLREGLLSMSFADDLFTPLVERFLKKGGEARFGDLARSTLILQIANLSRVDARDGQSRVETFSGAAPKLISAVRAACAIPALFPAVRLGEILDAGLPAGTTAGDLIMDAGIVDHSPLSPILGQWRQEGGAGTRRLFAVYNDPTRKAPPEYEGGFFGPGLHSLNLRDRLDMEFNANAVLLITRMVEALQGAGKPIPKDRDGNPFQPVHMTTIDPPALLHIQSISFPHDEQLAQAVSSGCKSALEALHSRLIRKLAGQAGATVPCPRVLEAARAAQADTAARDEYFRPLPAVCSSCPAVLMARPPDYDTTDTEELEPISEFPPFSEGKREHAPPVPGLGTDRGPVRPADAPPAPRPLLLAVPAGGVFLGVFQIGALGALPEYGLRPELYAGASVGTLFSFLLESSSASADQSVLQQLVGLMLDIPQWVDGAQQRPPGRLSTVIDAIAARWSHETVAPLRTLRPRALVDLFTGPAPAPGQRREADWLSFQRGADALLFTPLDDLSTGVPRDLGPAMHLSPAQWRAVRDTLAALGLMRLPEALPLFDVLAANLGFFDPGQVERGEVIGFRSIEEQLRRIVFPAANPTLAEYSDQKNVRFIFTVTNHTRGTLEHLGYHGPDTGSGVRSPNAVEASLAASSFPLAFRRRRGAEIFGSESVPTAQDLYADGGILNNFPSDSAFAYLRLLSGRSGYGWLGGARHRVLLLSLDAPMDPPRDHPQRSRALFNLVRAYRLGQDEKIYKTVITQVYINRIAPNANPVLAQRGEEQAIQADFDLIAPAREIYPHPFAFKPELGFTQDKQLQMMAAGCRRTRYALEWREFQNDHQGAPIADFEARYRAEIRTPVGSTEAATAPCVLRQLTPGYRTSQRPSGCPFAALSSDGARVYEACRQTADLDMPAGDPRF